MKTIIGAAVAVGICLAAIWVDASAPIVPRFTYSNNIIEASYDHR